MIRTFALSILIATCVLTPYLLFGHRSLVYVLMGVALASVSYLVFYRRLEFLAAGSTHAALFATSLAILVEYHTGVSYYLTSVCLGLMVVYIAGALIRSGMDPQKASAIIVSASSALAVISAHYVLRTVPGRVSLASLVLGDPLLISRDEALFGVTASIAVIVAVTVVRTEVVESSIDTVSARIAGVRVNLLELFVYTIVGFSSVVMLRLAGYVMEHVFLLLPAISSARFSSTTSEHFLSTLLVGAFAASIGYALGYVLKLAPTGVTGIVIIAIWLVFSASRWGR